ncbi:putative major facilitator superfamily transporter [Diaporthe ampelina]|uniref:Putative major facilitator superfamily transporter n=1 Tax=Diaporthe ampelina TaxID=1214573 RepID=A0A0G2HRM6_9PEZI|nr:putative major facilitator superfamily transporter [Diaporthe ampelina]
MRIWDSDNVDEYKELYIHPQWENWSAFDPKFRWTWKEERSVRRKVDWKIMVWVCIMFASLNIDRNNISNAVSDNMLEDLDLTKADYLISKRWVPVGPSIISGSQFFLNGRASFLATSYWYTGTSISLVLDVFAIRGAFTSRTKSWWNPNGYFNEKEEKIIVNSGESFRHDNIAPCQILIPLLP